MSTHQVFQRAILRSNRPVAPNGMSRTGPARVLSVCALALFSASCDDASDPSSSDTTAVTSASTSGSPSNVGPGPAESSSDSGGAVVPGGVGNPSVSVGGTPPSNTSAMTGGAIPSAPPSESAAPANTAGADPNGPAAGAGGTPGQSNSSPDSTGPTAGSSETPGESNSGGAGGIAGASPTGVSAGGESGSGGSGPAAGVSDDATIVPDPGWACGMADGIPSPTQGELAFSITLEISAEHEVGNTPYGYRRLLDVSGGAIAGDRLEGSVLTGGLEYELTLSNGVMEYQGINILETSDGSRIYVRSCGVAADGDSKARVIPDFEATKSGSYAFLNTGKWVATREVKDGVMTLDVYDVSSVTLGEPHVEIKKPDGVPPQPWECNMNTGGQGPQVLTENVTLGGSFSIPDAKYGARNIIPITGGTTTGKVTGKILNGGADYQLSGSLDAWYTLAPDNGEFILVRNCGATGGLIPWFEAAVDGEFDFLNTQAYLSSAPGVGGGGVSITFYERQ